MGCCNEPVSTLSGAPPDPTQHVNYARGMVLGVDDFTQEFAYLSGRVRWLARDAVGYGTLSGLRVFYEADGSQGPRLHVTPGSALMPSGQQVCVAADQCCVINSWLARSENVALVSRVLHPGSPPLSPPSSPPNPVTGETGTLSLFLTLCWADCLTRPVPVPGEPCRSDDELMAPSRVADDYRLELRATAPQQTEEDALRDFARWLRANLQIVDGSPPPMGSASTWRDALARAAGLWLSGPSASPPLSPPASFASLGDYLFNLSPPGLAVARAQLGDFLRVALRFWVTELRPLWMAMRCHRAQQPDTDCLLLAGISFQVSWIGSSPSGAWQITGSPPSVLVDDSTRPLLADVRMLQEWLLCGVAAPDLAPVPAPAPAPAPSPAPAPVLPARVPVLATATDLTLNASHGLVLCNGGQALTLPKSDAFSSGLSFIVKSINSDSKVVPLAGDVVSGPLPAPGLVAKGSAKTFVCDGKGTWHVVAAVA